MIDLNAVNDEIKRLEEDDLTYRIAEKLAVLEEKAIQAQQQGQLMIILQNLK